MCKNVQRQADFYSLTHTDVTFSATLSYQMFSYENKTTENVSLSINRLLSVS